MPKKDPHRNPRFQLRLEEPMLDALRRKAARLDVPLNHLIAGILERDLDDTSRYHQQMAAKQSFISVGLLNVLAARLLPVEVRQEVFRSIHEQANRAFGANPEMPESILADKSPTDSGFVIELLEMFERHASNHWNIRPD